MSSVPGYLFIVVGLLSLVGFGLQTAILGVALATGRVRVIRWSWRLLYVGIALIATGIGWLAVVR